jgi:hypothetical protein
MKALLLAMDRWTARGVAPPPARYPRIADGTLVAPDHCASRKCRASSRPRGPPRVSPDYGPGFAAEGIVTLEPPRIGTAFRSWCRRWMPTEAASPA